MPDFAQFLNIFQNHTNFIIKFAIVMPATSQENHTNKSLNSNV